MTQAIAETRPRPINPIGQERIKPPNPIAPDRSRINAQVAKLEQLLKDRKWAAADQETRRLLENLNRVPAPLIQAIDRAWLNASNNRWGLSVQAKIWQESRSKHPTDRIAATNAFRDRVGWKLKKPRAEQDFISSDWLNESELNYSLQAPVGHLPWAGVSDEVVRSVAIPPPGTHCGSCTIDAMVLRNERFYGYLPQLFARVQSAIKK